MRIGLFPRPSDSRRTRFATCAAARKAVRTARVGLTAAQIAHFRAWSENVRKFPGTKPKPSASRALFTAWVLVGILKRRFWDFDFFGNVPLKDHDNHAFARLAVRYGFPRPESRRLYVRAATRLLAASASIRAASSTHLEYRRQSLVRNDSGVEGLVDRRRVEKRLADGLAAYALVVVDATLRPNSWPAYITSANLSLRRMWPAFAASSAGVPLYLIFLDADPLLSRTGVQALSQRGLIAGCFAYEVGDPFLAGAPRSSPVTLLSQERPAATIQRPAPWRLGILAARTTDAQCIATFALSALQSRRAESVTILLHPSTSINHFRMRVPNMSGVRILSGIDILEFALDQDLIVSAGTSAVNSVARLGLPCWGLAGAIPAEADAAVWDTGRLQIPVLSSTGREFMDEMSCEELRRNSAALLHEKQRSVRGGTWLLPTPATELLMRISAVD